MHASVTPPTAPVRPRGTGTTTGFLAQSTSARIRPGGRGSTRLGVRPHRSAMAAPKGRHRLTGAALVLVTFPALAAAQQVELTLADAIRRALEVQPAIVQARGDQRNA